MKNHKPRLITTSYLKMKGFKYDEESKMWTKRFEMSNAYVTVDYRYDWNERKLYCKTYNTYGGWTRTEWVCKDEIASLQEMREMY